MITGQLQSFFCVTGDGCFINKLEVLKAPHLHLCLGHESGNAEELSVRCRPKGVLWQDSKEDPRECGDKDAAHLYTTADVKAEAF